MTSMTAGLQIEQLEPINRLILMGPLVGVEDAAAAAAFLMSEDATKVVGITLIVDAGSTA